jgi:Flp pilus assembly protein TadG
MKNFQVVPNALRGSTQAGLLPGRKDLLPQSGQTLLEVALMLPLLLLLTLGVIELGRYTYISILVDNAARAGAAYGAQSGGTSTDTAGIITAADNDFQNNGQSVSNLTVTSVVSCGCDNAGTLTVDFTTAAGCSDATSPGLPALISACVPPTGSGHWVAMVAVTGSGTFNGLFNAPGIGIPSSITVSKTATMRVQ